MQECRVHPHLRQTQEALARVGKMNGENIHSPSAQGEQEGLNRGSSAGDRLRRRAQEGALTKNRRAAHAPAFPDSGAQVEPSPSPSISTSPSTSTESLKSSLLVQAQPATRQGAHIHTLGSSFSTHQHLPVALGRAVQLATNRTGPKHHI